MSGRIPSRSTFSNNFINYPIHVSKDFNEVVLNLLLITKDEIKGREETLCSDLCSDYVW